MLEIAFWHISQLPLSLWKTLGISKSPILSYNFSSVALKSIAARNQSKKGLLNSLLKLDNILSLELSILKLCALHLSYKIVEIKY